LSNKEINKFRTALASSEVLVCFLMILSGLSLYFLQSDLPHWLFVTSLYLLFLILHFRRTISSGADLSFFIIVTIVIFLFFYLKIITLALVQDFTRASIQNTGTFNELKKYLGSSIGLVTFGSGIIILCNISNTIRQRKNIILRKNFSAADLIMVLCLLLLTGLFLFINGGLLAIPTMIAQAYLFRSGEILFDFNIFTNLLYLFYPLIFYILMKLEYRKMFTIRIITILISSLVMYLQSFSVSAILLFFLMTYMLRCDPVPMKKKHFLWLLFYLQLPVFLKSIYSASASGQQAFSTKLISILQYYYTDYHNLIKMVNSKMNSIEVLALLIKNDVYFGSGSSFARSMTTFLPKSFLGLPTGTETLGNKFFASNVVSGAAGGMNVTFFGAGYMSGGVLGVTIFSIVFGLILRLLDHLRIKVSTPLSFIFLNCIAIYGLIFFLRTGGPVITMKRLWLVLIGFILFGLVKQVLSVNTGYRKYKSK